MVHPQVPCVLFTPVCPHSLSFRPLMFPDHGVCARARAVLLLLLLLMMMMKGDSLMLMRLVG